MRLAVTRKAEQLTDLSLRAASLGIEVVPLPVIEIDPLPFGWPDGLSISSVDWVLATSSSGGRMFLERLKTLGIALSDKTQYGAVGPKTAEAMQALVGSVTFQPSRSYGEVMFEEFLEAHPKPGTVVYARGEQVNFDPSEIMARHKIDFHSIICYRTLSKTVPSDAVQQLDSNDYILFTAPSSVHSYH